MILPHKLLPLRVDVWKTFGAIHLCLGDSRQVLAELRQDRINLRLHELSELVNDLALENERYNDDEDGENFKGASRPAGIRVLRARLLVNTKVISPTGRFFWSTESFL